MNIFLKMMLKANQVEDCLTLFKSMKERDIYERYLNKARSELTLDDLPDSDDDRMLYRYLQRKKSACYPESSSSRIDSGREDYLRSDGVFPFVVLLITMTVVFGLMPASIKYSDSIWLFLLVVVAGLVVSLIVILVTKKLRRNFKLKTAAECQALCELIMKRDASTSKASRE